MIPSGFHLEPATWQNAKDQAALRAVRTEVFLHEQNIPEEEEWDTFDASSHHVLAFDDAGTPIACGRLTPDHHIGRMAVLKAWRGQHVGAAIFQHLLDLAVQLARPEIILHAQSYAVPFYSKFGFECEGEEFIECGIPHRLMRKVLGAPVPLHRDAHQGVAPDSQLIKFDSAQGASDANLAVLRRARHRAYVYARELDHLLASPELIVELKRVALSGAGARVQVLVQEPGTAVRDGHALLHLKQRLPSLVEIRVPGRDEDFAYPGAYVLNDEGGYAYRTLASRFEGESDLSGAPRQRQLLAHFEEIWLRAITPSDLHHAPL